MNMKNIAMWAIIVFLTIGLYNMFKNPQTNIRGGDKVIFSEFLTSVENGEVLKVEIQGNNIKGVFQLHLLKKKCHHYLVSCFHGFLCCY